MTDEPRGVLWDLDGTLVDTAQQHFAAWVEVFGPRGVTLSPEAVPGTFGRRSMDVLRDLLGEHLRTTMSFRSVPPRSPASGVRSWMATAPLPVSPTGCPAAIRRLAASDCLIGAARQYRGFLDRLGLHGSFDAVVGEEDVQRGKPDPQVSSRPRPAGSVTRAGHRRRGCTGRRRSRSPGGMRSIGVAGSHPAGYLDADLVVSSLADLSPDAFDQLLAAHPAG